MPSSVLPCTADQGDIILKLIDHSRPLPLTYQNLRILLVGVIARSGMALLDADSSIYYATTMLWLASLRPGKVGFAVYSSLEWPILSQLLCGQICFWPKSHIEDT